MFSCEYSVRFMSNSEVWLNHLPFFSSSASPSAIAPKVRFLPL